MKNNNLASAILDSTWGKLRQLTAYKAERRGGRVIRVNPNGSSQKCSRCGEMVPKPLSKRVHQCMKCGLVSDRDISAARNILKADLERSHAEIEPLLVKRISSFSRGSEKPTNLFVDSSLVQPVIDTVVLNIECFEFTVYTATCQPSTD